MYYLNLLGFNLYELNGITIIIRIILSLLCSAFLGFERVRKRRAAGVRTYVLVCVASSIVMMTSQYVAHFSKNTDLTRLGAQVISGIGFLGAGTIMMTGRLQVKGLTTAAGLWAAACIGIAIGAGFYLGGILLFIVAFLTLSVMGVYQNWYTQRLNRLQLYLLLDDAVSMDDFITYIRCNGMVLEEIDSLEAKPLRSVGMLCTVKSEVHKDHNSMIGIITAFKGVQHTEEI